VSDVAERRRRLKRTDWIFHVAGSAALLGGLVAGSPWADIAGAVLLAIGFRLFFMTGRLRG
jgi:divalent metal cation (Fe/Co/Zn/Cd) transporter